VLSFCKLDHNQFSCPLPAMLPTVCRQDLACRGSDTVGIVFLIIGSALGAVVVITCVAFLVVRVFLPRRYGEEAQPLHH